MLIYIAQVPRNRANVHQNGVYSVHCNLESHLPALNLQLYLPQRCPFKGFKDTVNLTCLSRNGRSLEIMLQVPLILFYSRFQVRVQPPTLMLLRERRLYNPCSRCQVLRLSQLLQTCIPGNIIICVISINRIHGDKHFHRI